jgi:hypothetical protein
MFGRSHEICVRLAALGRSLAVCATRDDAPLVNVIVGNVITVSGIEQRSRHPARSEGPRLCLGDHTNLCGINNSCEIPRRLRDSG